MLAAVLCERLAMSTGAASMTLKELQEWGVVRRVWRPGERREFFEAETDFWKMISKVINERERHLAQAVRERLARAVVLLGGASASAAAKGRLERARRLLSFASIAETVLQSFVASRLADFSEFGNLLELKRPVGPSRKG
jgi:DNA-binding transcriptional regulator GbsR (MarR family)